MSDLREQQTDISWMKDSLKELSVSMRNLGDEVREAVKEMRKEIQATAKMYETKEDAREARDRLMKEIEDIKVEKEKLVRQEQFLYVSRLVYGMVGIVLTAVAYALLNVIGL